MSKIPTRDEALELLKQYNDSDSLVRHGMAVEAVMKHFAEKMGEDPEKWGIIGLVHDLDYEKYPEQHCTMTRQILEEHDWPEEYIRAIMSHAWGMCTDEKPEHPMEKVLYATDELTGLITAAVYVRPSRSILDLTVKSVKKKWKTKSFAAGANREVIMQGAELLGTPLEELMAETIAGMQKEADALDLRGEL
jgi:putative nucleotidyltransferase with HDIG domain